ncbi:MAG TPA: hypothetical protein VK999_07310 [Methylotenera sp.]|nr:hypothetical protein [Methylotenera sp.]
MSAAINRPFSFQQLRIVLATLSLLLSVFALLSDDIINSDGILYIQMAEAFMQGGLAAMANLYDWPFFALLVGLISQISGLHPETSAGILNTLLFVIFTDALLLIAKQLVPNFRQLMIAALLILLFYSINNYRDFIIRDIGYWAFTSLALLQFIYFLRDRRWQQALLWQFFGLIALLFRIEASIILLAMPLFLLFCDRKEPLLKSLLQLYTLLLIAGVMSVITMVIGVGWTEAFGKLGSITNYLDFAGFQNRFAGNTQIIADNILHPVADDEAGRVLFFGLIGMLAMELLLGLSAAYLLIFLLTRKVRVPLFASQESKAIAFFLLINIGILTAFCLQQYFVTSRYCVMAFVAIFMLVLPRLTAFIDTIYLQRQRGQQVLVALLLIYSLGDVVYQSNSKIYIPKIAKWAAEQLPPDSKLLTSSSFIVYYANKYADDDLDITLRPALKAYQQFDYLIMVEKHDNQTIKKQLASMSLQAMFSYENERGDKASVYQVLKPTNPSN